MQNFKNITQRPFNFKRFAIIMTRGRKVLYNHSNKCFGKQLAPINFCSKIKKMQQMSVVLYTLQMDQVIHIRLDWRHES